MVLFFQFDVRGDFGLPFVSGSHLSLFMCPIHNDAPEMLRESQLLPAFWERRRTIDGLTRFYEMRLDRPGSVENTHPVDLVLLSKRLRFERKDESFDQDGGALEAHPRYSAVSLSVGEFVKGIEGFKVGGQPTWAQGPEVHRCCCGADMTFVCQVPLNFPFPKMPEAPEQPDSFSADDYCLFLGNETYIFACEAQCDPRAVHIVVQN
jgi:hypothetical protein